MHICQIDIDNFKSFAERTVIPFRPGFTTVSGPNGSGKSNIIDSILFCLGLSTSRTMRAEKLSDLINNLSKRQEAVVTITFLKGEHEQAMTRQLPLPKPDKNDELPASQEAAEAPDDNLIRVTRRIKGTPSGYTSTYYLNAKISTLTEIHETLGQYNVSPGSFNVMMQGDVAGFINMSAMERRKIIDEIAGVAEFDRKIEQAQQEMAITGANIERNTILLNEIEARMGQLAQEREQALKYRGLRDEKNRCESQLLSARYIDLQKALRPPTRTLSTPASRRRMRKNRFPPWLQRLPKPVRTF